MSADVGAGHASFIAPAPSASSSGPSLSASLSFGGDLDSELQLSGRLHVVIKGRDDVTGFGPDVRFRRGMFMAALALELSHAHGPATAESRADAIGVGAELRVGIRLGSMTVVANAFAVDVMENEVQSFTGRLGMVLDFGLAVGCELR